MAISTTCLHGRRADQRRNHLHVLHGCHLSRFTCALKRCHQFRWLHVLRGITDMHKECRCSRSPAAGRMRWCSWCSWCSSCLPHACICRFTEFGFAAKSVVKEFSSTLVTKSHLFAAASGRMQHALALSALVTVHSFLLSLEFQHAAVHTAACVAAHPPPQVVL